MRSMRLTTNIVKIILLVGIAIGSLAIAYYAGYERGKQASPHLTPIQTLSQAPSTQSSPIDTSAWRTYRNEEHEFEVRYPNDWVLEEEKSFEKIVGLGEKKLIETQYGKMEFFKEGFTVIVYRDLSELPGNKKEGFSLKKWICEEFILPPVYGDLRGEECIKAITFGVGNYKGILVKKYRTVGIISIISYVFIQRNHAIYEIRDEMPTLGTTREDFPTKYDYDKCFEQMLSTFRFIK